SHRDQAKRQRPELLAPDQKTTKTEHNEDDQSDLRSPAQHRVLTRPVGALNEAAHRQAQQENDEQQPCGRKQVLADCARAEPVQPLWWCQGRGMSHWRPHLASPISPAPLVLNLPLWLASLPARRSTPVR